MIEQLAKDFCQADLMTVTPGHSLRDAEQHLLDQNVSELFVVTESGHLVGVLTDYDLLKARLLGDVDEAHVARWMCGCPASVAAQSTLADCVKLFREAHYRRLAVLENGRFVGVLTRSDALRALSQRPARTLALRHDRTEELSPSIQRPHLTRALACWF